MTAKKAESKSTKPTASKAATAEGPVWRGAFAAFGQAFNQVKTNPTPALVFVGTYLVLTLVSVAAQGGKMPTSKSYISYEDITYLLFLLAVPIYALAVADQRTISVHEFLHFDLKKYLSVLAAGILFVLIIGLSLLLLIVPIIWTAAWFFVASYAVVDKRLGPIEALKESKRLTEKHKAKVWGIVGVTILFSLLSIPLARIPFIGIAVSAFVELVAGGASAILYRWLQEQSPAA